MKTIQTSVQHSRDLFVYVISIIILLVECIAFPLVTIFNPYRLGKPLDAFSYGFMGVAEILIAVSCIFAFQELILEKRQLALRLAKILGGVVLVTLIILYVMWFFLGRVTITSTITDAGAPVSTWKKDPFPEGKVIIDDEKVCDITPCTYHALPGWHTVSLILPAKPETWEGHELTFGVLTIPWENQTLTIRRYRKSDEE